MKTLLQTFAGILLTLTGVAVMYYFLTTLDKGANYLFLGVSLLFVGGGVFFFLQAGKSDSTVTAKMPADVLKAIENVTSDGSKTLEKNNEMIKEWSDTNNKKDKLKTIQMAASAQAQDVASKQ